MPWIVSLALALLAALLPLGPTPAEAAAAEPRAETAAFCLGVVMSAGQVFAMRPPQFMTRADADLVIRMPDRRARALALAGDSWRREGAIDAEGAAAARQAGASTLMRLLAEGGYHGADYRALRDSCRALGDALGGTDHARREAAYEQAAEQAGRYLP